MIPSRSTDPFFDEEDLDNPDYYCVHGNFIGNPYGGDYMCQACEDGLCAHGHMRTANDPCRECGDRVMIVSPQMVRAFREEIEPNVDLDTTKIWADWQKGKITEAERNKRLAMVGLVDDMYGHENRLYNEWLTSNYTTEQLALYDAEYLEAKYHEWVWENRR